MQAKDLITILQANPEAELTYPGVLPDEEGGLDLVQFKIDSAELGDNWREDEEGILPPVKIWYIFNKSHDELLNSPCSCPECDEDPS